MEEVNDTTPVKWIRINWNQLLALVKSDKLAENNTRIKFEGRETKSYLSLTFGIPGMDNASFDFSIIIDSNQIKISEIKTCRRNSSCLIYKEDV